MQTVDTVIVGGGFSAIPLVRELEKAKKSFIFISKIEPIWHTLEKNNVLDFDLVSSLYTSVYSFELVSLLGKKQLQDSYPTAKAFFQLHKKYRARYQHKIIQGEVTEICQHTSHSVLTLADGREYQANHVVLATSFKRKIHDSLSTFDWQRPLKGKTVVVTSVGDSSNLLMSKLVGLEAKVHLVSNGFFALDKFVFLPDITSQKPYKTFTLDQLEYHTIANYFPALYQKTVTGGYQQAYQYPFLAKYLFNPSLATQHPLTKRHDFFQNSHFWTSFKDRFFYRKVPVLNGNIAIKYWPIDTYHTKFSHDLENNIRAGYLLNDLPFFIDQNAIQLWSKQQTTLDKKNKIIQNESMTLQYDYLIEGDREVPNLPLIYHAGHKDTPFQYQYRSLYMGISSPNCPNLYFLGYTRPITGGLCNIIEMQSLFIYEMITNTDFHFSIYNNIQKRVDTYNQTHYRNKELTPADHLVFYGFYTNEIAISLGIQPHLKEVKSISDLLKYFFFPRNAFYYREKGRYQVKGVNHVIQHIFKDHGYFIFNFVYLLRYALLELTAIMMILLLPLSFIVSVPLAIIHYHLPFSAFLNGKMALPTLKSKKWLKTTLLMTNIPLWLCPLITLYVKSWWTPGLCLLYIYSLTSVLSKKGWYRHVFCDMQSKKTPKYISFLNTYKATFQKVFTTKTSSDKASVDLSTYI